MQESLSRARDDLLFWAVECSDAVILAFHVAMALPSWLLRNIGVGLSVFVTDALSTS